MKHSRPKILFIDTQPGLEKLMRERGFNVEHGTLGKPYSVPRSSNLCEVIPNFDLPAVTEKEIIVVDFERQGIDPGPSTTMHIITGQVYDYARCNYGVVDPREFQVRSIREDMDRILDNGACFVVFASPRIAQETARARKQVTSIANVTPNPVSIWHLNSALEQIVVTPDEGEEMECCSNDTALDLLIAKHLDGATFNCWLDWPGYLKTRWRPLVKNKYGQTVACIIKQPEGGQTIVLPRLADMEGFIRELFTMVLPQIAPALFPFAEGGQWLHHKEYELPSVVAIQDEQEVIMSTAQERITELDQQIVAEREQHGWIYNLLNGTDASLVDAVKVALNFFGFRKIVDVDFELDAKGKSRREDLQIHDRDHVLIIDVKGVGGGIADDYVLQAEKHATLRLKEWRKVGPDHHPEIDDITGLAIINHQRNLPPLSRENTSPFRQELLDIAEEQAIGLLTAWDLYRIVRNKERWGWQTEDVMPLLYRKGRILPLPLHYQRIGVIAKPWSDKFGIVLEADALNVGDTIAIEFPILFEEHKVTSIHVNDAQVDVAHKGDEVGLLWSLKDHKLRENMVVYVVRSARKVE